MIVDHSFTAEHLEAIAKHGCLVVQDWRHQTLKPGDVVEVTGGHRGVFVREIQRHDFERRVIAAGAPEWLDAPSDAHFWEVTFD